MGSRNLAQSNVAVVPVPRRPTVHKIAPMLESLARLGLHSSDISSLTEKVARFRKTARSAVGKAVLLHTKRFAEGHYEENDPDFSEQDRMNTAITLSVYLIKNIERIHKAAAIDCDTGTTTLAETAVDEVSRLLTSEFFEMDQHSISLAVLDVLPFVHASLSTAKLSEHALSLPEAYEVHKEDTLKMIDAAYIKLYGPEEAA